MAPPSPDARRAAFSAFVQRALEHAQAGRGLSVPKIATLSGVGDSTIYRWRDGHWKSSPSADQVVAFCNALGIKPSVALRILWPDPEDKIPEPEPLPLDPEMQTILRKLRDPNVSEQEKFHIRATLGALAARPSSEQRRTG